MPEIKLVKNRRDKEILGGHMFVASPQIHSSIQVFTAIDVMCKVGAWSLITNAGLCLNDARQYADKFKEWQHNRGSTEHNNIGMAWAWKLHEAGHYVELADSPDLYARFNNGNALMGDIGQCTFMAWMDGIKYLGSPGDIWVSVLGWNTQVVIEIQGDLSLAFSHLGEMYLPPPAQQRIVTPRNPIKIDHTDYLNANYSQGRLI